MTDAFVNATYGVVLNDEAMALIETAYLEIAAALRLSVEDEMRMEIDEEHEDDDLEYGIESLGHWLKSHPAKYAAIREAAGAPDDACLFYTGSPDDHPYRSATPPDTYLIGYGLFHFPGAVGVFSEKATWLTWVTA